MASLWPKLVNPNDPNFVPRAEDVKAFVQLSQEIRRLVGVDGLTVEAAVEPSDHADRIADDLEEFGQLMNRMFEEQIGVLDTDDVDVDRTEEVPSYRARPPSVSTDRDQEAVVECRPVGDFEESLDAMSKDLDREDEPEPAGRWIDGRWVPDDESRTPLAS